MTAGTTHAAEGGAPRAPPSVRPAKPSRWWRRLPWTAGRTVLVYVVISVVWIVWSDDLLFRLVEDGAVREQVSIGKGALFVLVTAGILYAMIRRGEMGLRSLGTEMRATIDSMADAVLLVDARSNVVEANRAAVELLGARGKDEILGPLEDWGRRFGLRFMDGSPVPLDRYATMRALSGERVPGYDAVIRRGSDGRDVWVSVSAAPVLGSGRHHLAVAVLRDVSDRRRLELMRDEFLSTAAHEFKTPLAVVKAYAQLLQKREPEQAQALTVIERQVDRLDRLVQQLLDVSRLRADPGEGRRERFDLGLLCTEVVERLRAAAPLHALAVHVAGTVTVEADRARIARVLTSLVDNAVRFSPRGGPVEATVHPSGADVVVSIRDRGLGIAPDRQQRIFERFYSAHAGTTDDYGGLGLGLDASREIVERHGGRMWFESVPGQGSTFHFSLPVAAGGAA